VKVLIPAYSSNISSE